MNKKKPAIKKDLCASELLAEAEEVAKNAGMDYSEFDVAEAAWWYANFNHGGQWTYTYRAMSQIGYRPGAAKSGPDKGSVAEAIYDGMCDAIDGESPILIQQWENRARAAHALQAVRAYAKAKNEKEEEGDITCLISDLLHLLALVYEPEGEDEQVKRLNKAVDSAAENIKNETCAAATYEATRAHEMSEEMQEQLATFIKENGLYEIDAITKPKGA